MTEYLIVAMGGFIIGALFDHIIIVRKARAYYEENERLRNLLNQTRRHYGRRVMSEEGM